MVVVPPSVGRKSSSPPALASRFHSAGEQKGLQLQPTFLHRSSQPQQPLLSGAFWESQNISAEAELTCDFDGQLCRGTEMAGSPEFQDTVSLIGPALSVLRSPSLSLSLTSQALQPSSASLLPLFFRPPPPHHLILYLG